MEDSPALQVYHLHAQVVSAWRQPVKAGAYFACRQPINGPGCLYIIVAKPILQLQAGLAVALPRTGRKGFDSQVFQPCAQKHAAVHHTAIRGGYLHAVCSSGQALKRVPQRSKGRVIRARPYNGISGIRRRKPRYLQLYSAQFRYCGNFNIKARLFDHMG
ncbi:MAG: hypothetical protein KDC66_23760 [Phaeodactylibacter sp.]|nr:hypothetical protein [Phaeodactylibacter sp.]